jgi:hypothetical protein
MAEAISHWPLTTEARVGPCGQSVLGQVSRRVIQFSPSISFHYDYLCSYITEDMNNRPIGGHSLRDIVSPH